MRIVNDLAALRPCMMLHVYDGLFGSEGSAVENI